MRKGSLSVLFIFLTFLPIAEATDPPAEPCHLALLAAREKLLALGNGPKKHHHDDTRVTESIDGSTIFVTANFIEGTDLNRVEYTYKKKADGRYDVQKVTSKNGEVTKTELYESDAAPISFKSMRDRKIEQRAQIENEKRLAMMLETFMQNHDIAQDAYLRANEEIEKVNVAGSKNWNEGERNIHAVNLALVLQPAEKLVKQMLPGIQLLNYNREAVTGHLDGTLEYTDTMFDPQQQNYVDVIGALATARTLGMNGKMIALQNELLRQLDTAGAFK